jgi:PhnB protein
MSQKTKTTDEAQIRAVIEEWADALRNKEPTRTLSHYDPNLVHFSLAPPLLSTASNPEGLNAWFDTWLGPIGYEIRNLSIRVGDDVAFSHSLNWMHGAKGDLWFRHMFGFQRIKGEWKIAHEHESVPFYMDGSFKAAIDLKP